MEKRANLCRRREGHGNWKQRYIRRISYVYWATDWRELISGMHLKGGKKETTNNNNNFWES